MTSNFPSLPGSTTELFMNIDNNLILTPSVVDAVYRLADLLSQSKLTKRLLKYFEPLDSLVPKFTRTRDRRLARAIYEEIVYDSTLQYTVTIDEVIAAVSTILTQLFHEASCYIDESSIKTMLDSYPLTLLSEICKVTFDHASILGHNMKIFINLRDSGYSRLPKPFENIIGSTIPLTGHPKSPLTEHELQALFLYLGIRKRIYVELLLGCLFDLGQYLDKLNSALLNEEDIITVCNSGWFYLLSFNVCPLSADINTTSTNLLYLQSLDQHSHNIEGDQENNSSDEYHDVQEINLYTLYDAMCANNGDI